MIHHFVGQGVIALGYGEGGPPVARDRARRLTGPDVDAMKTLFLLRHAKSSWKDPTLTDFDRPLSGRGRKAGKRMRKHLRSNGIRPALILCSGAERTRETLKYVKPAFDRVTEIVIEDDLYLAGADRILQRIHKVADAVPSLMVIGHNPDMEILALSLCGRGNEELLHRMEAKYPTGALAVLGAGIDAWRDLSPGTATLEAFVRPVDLEGD